MITIISISPFDMDNLTIEQRKKNMRCIRSKDTGPEKTVFKELRKRKIYFCPHPSIIYGRPDLVFRRKKVAVFIDSDFWHGHPKRFTMPKTNRTYWRQKIKRNIERDKQVNMELRKDGWKVVRIWEHDIKRNPEKAIAKILSAIGKIC